MLTGSSSDHRLYQSDRELLAQSAKIITVMTTRHTNLAVATILNPPSIKAITVMTTRHNYPAVATILNPVFCVGKRASKQANNHADEIQVTQVNC